MSKLLALASKKFKGLEDVQEFTAKSNKAIIIMEDKSNVSAIDLFLNGRKKPVLVDNLFGFPTQGAVFEQEFIKGEKYSLIFRSALERMQKEDKTYVARPSSIELSIVWENN